MATTKQRVDDVRLAALERVAMDLWPDSDSMRSAMVDLCADLRQARGLPQTPGIYGSAMPMTADAGTDRPETIEERRERERAEDLARVMHDFTWHPVHGEQLESIKMLAGMFVALAAAVVRRAPRNRNRSLALTKLEEARMHFNAAVAKGEQQ